MKQTFDQEQQTLAVAGHLFGQAGQKGRKRDIHARNESMDSTALVCGMG